MKKLILTFSLLVLGMGLTFGQSTIWKPYNINIDTSWGIRYLSAVDSNTVWAIAFSYSHNTNNTNVFVRATNGGNNMRTGNIFPTSAIYSMSNICALDSSVAFVAAYDSAGSGASGKIMKTMDGGLTWKNASDSSTMFIGASNFPDFVHFWDHNNGLALGDPNGNTGGGTTNEFEIWRTHNGGTNWTRVADANIPNPSTGEAGLTDSYTSLGKRMWFGTTKGRVYMSSDSGKTWTVSTGVNIGLAGGTQGLAFRDSVHGMAWGLATSAATTVILKKTNNGGITWSAVTLDPNNTGLNDFCVIPGRNSYMSVGINSGATAYVTSITPDDGTTWNLLETGTTNPIRMLQVQMLDSAHGWAGNLSDTSRTLGKGGINKYMGPKIAQSCPLYVTSTKASICSVNDSTTLSVSGATTYSWSTSATTASITVHPTASVTYSVTGNIVGCTNTQTVNVSVSPNFTLTLNSHHDTICVGNAANLIANGGTTYAWTPLTGLSASTGSAVAASPTVTTNYTVTATSGACKNATTLTVTVNACVGIAEVSNLSSIQIFPNPSTGLITVQLSQINDGTSLHITDMLGKEVYTTVLNNDRSSMDISTLQKGMYVLTITSGQAKHMQKLIIQ